MKTLTNRRCGYTIWPYTENNFCVLDPHEAGDHQDKRGRKFNHAGYLKGERKRWADLNPQEQINVAFSGDPDDDDSVLIDEEGDD